jgi:MinD superfamily P-loop ATPase
MKIAIASGKGGTGKTTLATNLAVSFSAERHTILADMDVEEPNSGLFIKGPRVKRETMYRDVPEWDEDLCTLCGECTANCNFNALVRIASRIIVFPNLCHSCFACSELCPAGALPMSKMKIGTLTQKEWGKLTFIESHLDVGQEKTVPLISKTLAYIDKLNSKADIVILDSPPGASCPVIEVVKDSDYVILVTEPTPFGLNDLRIAVDTVRLLKVPFGVVINRDGIGNNEVAEYCKSENVRIIASIPDSREIAELYSRGELSCNVNQEFESGLNKIKEFINLLL